MRLFGKGLPCPILYSSRHSFYNLIQCPSLAQGSLVQIVTLHTSHSFQAPHDALWQGAPLFKSQLFTARSKTSFSFGFDTFLAGGSLVQIPMLQGSRSEDFLLPHRTMKRHISLFIVHSHPCVHSLSTAAPLHPSRARYANHQR